MTHLLKGKAMYKNTSSDSSIGTLIVKALMFMTEIVLIVLCWNDLFPSISKALKHLPIDSVLSFCATLGAISAINGVMWSAILIVFFIFIGIAAGIEKLSSR